MTFPDLNQLNNATPEINLNWMHQFLQFCGNPQRPYNCRVNSVTYKSHCVYHYDVLGAGANQLHDAVVLVPGADSCSSLNEWTSTRKVFYTSVEEVMHFVAMDQYFPAPPAAAPINILSSAVRAHICRPLEFDHWQDEGSHRKPLGSGTCWFLGGVRCTRSRSAQYTSPTWEDHIPTEKRRFNLIILDERYFACLILCCKYTFKQQQHDVGDNCYSRKTQCHRDHRRGNYG